LNKQNSFDISRGSARVRTRHLEDLYLEDFSIQAAHSSLQAKGGWNNAGVLQGEIRVKEEAKSTSYKVSGTRDRPQFSKNLK
jgi:hypothetical protein